jgi:hypothetical protein
MPITYQIDKARKLVRTKCVGDVTFNEVMEHFQALCRDPDCPQRLDVLLDLSELNAIPDPQQIREVSNTIGDIRDRVEFNACAIVARSDVLFGMARMFASLAENQFHATNVFRTVDQGEMWLISHKAKTA